MIDLLPKLWLLCGFTGEVQHITAIQDSDSGLVSFQQSVMNALGDAQTDESVTFVSEQTLVTSAPETQHQPEQSQAIASIQETTEQNSQSFQPQPDNSIVQVHPCVNFIVGFSNIFRAHNVFVSNETVCSASGSVSTVF